MSACVSAPALAVRVNAVTRPGVQLESGAPLCIRVAESQKAPSKLVKQVIAVCSRAARGQGLRVVDEPSEGPCLHTELRWYAEARPERQDADRCEEIFGAAFCRRSDPHRYGKALALDFVDAEREPPLKVHDIKASMATRNPGFNDATAEALCEAAFRQFPMRRTNTLYEIEM